MPVEFYEEYSWPKLFGWTPSIVELNGGIGRFDSESPLGAVRFTFDQMGRYLSRPVSQLQQSSSEVRERLKEMKDEADRALKGAQGEARDRLQRVRDEIDRVWREMGGGGGDDKTSNCPPGEREYTDILGIKRCGKPLVSDGPGTLGGSAAGEGCATFDVGCYLENFFASETAKDVGKRVGLVLLAVVLLAVAVISLR